MGLQRPQAVGERRDRNGNLQHRIASPRGLRHRLGGVQKLEGGSIKEEGGGGGLHNLGRVPELRGSTD